MAKTASSSNYSNINTIANVAKTKGVDPYLAEAIAYVESGFSATAVGDQGTSFGLFQLHKGGELGNLSQAQAFNPQTNANVALTEVAAVQKANPNASPGQIAALAQRPRNPSAYATQVNQVYNLLKAGQLPGYQGSAITGINNLATGGGNWNFITGSAGATQAAKNVGSVATSGITGITHFVATLAGQVLFIILGIVLVGIGLSVAFKGTSGGQAVGGAAKDTALAAA